MINKAVAKNFNTLRKAFGRNETCVMECKRKKDGEVVNLICAVQFDGKEYVMIPFAEMMTGDPFEDYYPPNSDGGFLEGDLNAGSKIKSVE